jgi:hypothetical protein
MTGTARGKCLCGAIQFELDLPTNWVAHCHCSICRRAHGAPFVTWVSVPDERFRITAGEEHLARYDSTSEATRSFCRVCGSTLLFQSKTRWAGETHIARANIDDPVDLPMVHAFLEDRADWVLFDNPLDEDAG